MAWDQSFPSMLLMPVTVVALALISATFVMLKKRTLNNEHTPKPPYTPSEPTLGNRPVSPVRRQSQRRFDNDGAAECLAADEVAGISYGMCDMCSKLMQDEPVTNLACGHRFHANCAEKWVDTLCPVCQGSRMCVPPSPFNIERRSHNGHEINSEESESASQSTEYSSVLEFDEARAPRNEYQYRKVSSKCPLCSNRIQNGESFIVRHRHKFHKQCLRSTLIDEDIVSIEKEVITNPCDVCTESLTSRETTTLSCGCVFHADCSKLVYTNGTACLSCGQDLETIKVPLHMKCLLCTGSKNVQTLSCSCCYHERCLSVLLDSGRGTNCPNCRKPLLGRYRQ